MNPESFFLWAGRFASNVYGTGLFPSVLLAQAALETGYGKSQLAQLGKNFFGIKADKAWKGDTITMPTREVINGDSVMIEASFRAYETPEQSFRDRNSFLKRNIRYTRAGVFQAKTPEEQAIALQKAGYATDPNYARTLIQIIRRFNLTRFDLTGKKKEL